MLPYFCNQVTCVETAERGGKGGKYSQAQGDGGGSRVSSLANNFFPFLPLSEPAT